ncbi:MAG TPA: FAD-dependent tricarballylate dehydrogenase TcuA [Bryobacteraceae bacterium]|nr:FAD-dependent tricarballylate dehydrogenase TcuA [Bryobacteraceae bacterium]
MSETFDVLIAGGGNAAMCAALSAREAGATVVVAECAPQHMRAGNSRHARNFRCMHASPTSVLTDAYTEEEYFKDLLQVTGGQTDEELARLAIRSSSECFAWMTQHGVRFQPSLAGTLHLGRTNAFFLGGGKALVNTYYAIAARLGIRVLYNAEVTGLCINDGRFEGATVTVDGAPAEIRAKTLVAASGGFEANIEWLSEAWGDAAKNFIIRGTPYNRGKVLRLLVDHGADRVGDPSQCHAIALDARAPKFDGGIVTRLDTVPLGIVVNRHGQRFYDEGEDLWPKRYAIWGRLIAQQPDQIAYSIVDSKTADKVMPSAFPAMEAQTIRELAGLLKLPADVLDVTVTQFNRSVVEGSFDHTRLDNCSTRGLSPDKTHWALKLDSPPFLGYPLRPGITFTYLGVKVNGAGQVIFDGRPAPNVFAAGEIMAGNILGQGYLAGFGMTIGTVFGRISGTAAARAAGTGAAHAAR